MSCLLMLLLCRPGSGQSGLLLRDHPQAGLANTRAELTNPESADAEDQTCLAKAEDMVTVQRCDDAEIKRQKARMGAAYAALLKVPDVDRKSVIASQVAWRKYFDSAWKSWRG